MARSRSDAPATPVRFLVMCPVVVGVVVLVVPVFRSARTLLGRELQTGLLRKCVKVKYVGYVLNMLGFGPTTAGGNSTAMTSIRKHYASQSTFLRCAMFALFLLCRVCVERASEKINGRIRQAKVRIPRWKLSGGLREDQSKEEYSGGNQKE
ncbi:hypothetical protein SRHO_G00025940 [Serrasalmus rhombeus]